MGDTRFSAACSILRYHWPIAVRMLPDAIDLSDHRIAAVRPRLLTFNPGNLIDFDAKIL
jgi:hypothetical protein